MSLLPDQDSSRLDREPRRGEFLNVDRSTFQVHSHEFHVELHLLTGSGKPIPTGQYVAIYVRISSSTQDTRSQEPDLRRWAEASASSVVWYQDQASGTTMARPGRDRLVTSMAALVRDRKPYPVP